MKIRGGCHCGNIGFELDFPGEPKDLAVLRRVPLVTSDIDSRLYEVVNVNTDVVVLST